ncbi:MAG: hypothetical protein AAF575_00010 [Bacteroidota bacterium]
MTKKENKTLTKKEARFWEWTFSPIKVAELSPGDSFQFYDSYCPMFRFISFDGRTIKCTKIRHRELEPPGLMPGHEVDETAVLHFGHRAENELYQVDEESRFIIRKGTGQ